MIPDYESAMRPLLEFLCDGRDRTLAECRDALAVTFSVTDEEKTQLLPSGRTPLFNSRVRWAKTYLGKAGAVHSTARGHVQITERGRLLLTEQVGRISAADLVERYTEFREWKEASRAAQVAASSPDGGTYPEAATELPPDESLGLSFRRYRETVQSELLDLVKSMPPEFFERLVVDLLLRLGYGGSFGNGLRLGRTGDRGMDGVINQDKLGLDLLYVQAKRWTDSVGAPVVREFAGALSAHRS